jgi:ABC-type sugar transport system permease subunit
VISYIKNSLMSSRIRRFFDAFFFVRRVRKISNSSAAQRALSYVGYQKRNKNFFSKLKFNKKHNFLCMIYFLIISLKPVHGAVKTSGSPLMTTEDENIDNTDLSLKRFIPDINVYQNRSSAGTAMMDLALLVTNVNQIQHIIRNFKADHTIFFVSLSFVSLSILLQIIVGIFLAINCQYNVKDGDDICKANRINNWVTVLIFLITVINVVIPALGIPA